MGNIYLDYSFRVGEKYISTEGYELEIVEYLSKKEVSVKINNFILSGLQYAHIKNGHIKNPFHKSVYGVGYIGVGNYKSKELNKNTKVYTKWFGLMERCYSKKYQEKRPTYKGCTVDERWHNFQVFAEWAESNYKEGFHLDKDILIKGNKIYSPETCALVPQEINCLFTKTDAKRGALPIGVSLKNKRYCASMQKNSTNGKQYIGTFDTEEEAFQAYKIAKESYIKEVANIWKDQIEPRVYEAMYNYQVEITD